ncbi:DNA polymerase III subunit gamma and tau [Nocardia sp. NPDC051030]|uniref:DNA polymerase III subunit gamma and tau n=1 Tax=Nocardia sp. NPDC051030 TaxID=3155162 RepID=UPI00342338B6
MALYRKYRPATFAEVVGQEHVTDPLSIALDTGRISHAYLFSGPRGCGKTSSARILARSLNCVEGPTSKPCGVCSSCVALGPGGPGNLDVIELDAASHGGVDDTRELRDRAFYAPAESRYRVFIIDEAHMVTTAGFNALLKIVEEPPAHLIFVFATTEPDKVLPTIRSRTHHYPFRLLPPATMRGLLGKICDQENVQVEEAVYPLVIRAGGGSPRDSLSVLDQLLAGAGPEGVTYPRAVSLLGVTDVALIDDAIEALAASDGAALFGTIDRVVEAGHDPRRFATDFLERLRDLILMRAVPDATERNLVTGPGDVLDRMRDQAARLGSASLARYAELLHEGLGDMRGATAPRLLLEVIAARMLLPAVSDAETATLQRLETLERRMAGGAPPPSQPAQAAASAPRSAAPASAPAADAASRRRGAEALAALRAEKTPTPEAPAADPQQPAAPAAAPAPQQAQAQPAAPVATPQQQTVAPAAAPATQSAAVRPPEMNAVRGTSAAEDAPAVPPAPPHPAERAAAQQVSASAAPSGGAGRLSGSEADSAVEVAAPEVADRAAAAPQASTVPSAAEAAVAQQVSANPSHAEVVEQLPGSAAPAVVESAVPEVADREVAAPPAAEAQRISTSAAAEPGESDSADLASVGESDAAALDFGQDAPIAAQNVPGDVTSASMADVPAQAELSAPEPVAVAEPAAAVETPAAVDAPVEVPADEPEPAVAAEDSASSGDDVLREIEGAWADIRAKVREFGVAVQAMMNGASVSRLEGQTIVFAHQNGPLAQRLSQPQNLDAVRSAVKAVLGRDHDVRWEVGGAGPAPAARAGGAAGRGAAGATAAPEKKAAPKFSRPSQSKAAGGGAAAAVVNTAATATEWGTAPTAAVAAPAQPVSAPSTGGDSRGGDTGSGVRQAPPEDDIPLPDGPDLPDDPGPSDYSSVGYDGVPPAATPEEEREMLEAAATPVPAGERRDPDEVALDLLRSELGATPLEG